MKFTYFFILPLLFITGCFTPRVSAKAQPRYELEERYYLCPALIDVEMRLGADIKFDLSELMELNAGANTLHHFTSGHANIKVELEDDLDSITIHKVLSTDPVIVGHDITHPFKSMALTTNVNIYLVMDRIPPGKLQGVFMHELAHFVGFGWAACDSSKTDCWHSPNPLALMYFEYRGAMKYTKSDLKMCQASCLCPNN